MTTIVKTGAVLSVEDWEKFGRNQGIGRQLYGDLHIVGNAAVMYYPPNQEMVESPRPNHGVLLLGPAEYSMFHRTGEPFSILIVQAKFIKMKKSALHSLDMNKWIAAQGGVLG